MFRKAVPRFNCAATASLTAAKGGSGGGTGGGSSTPTPTGGGSATTTSNVADGITKGIIPNTLEELAELTPKHIVEILDKFIVGQQPAKKAMAVSLRNRWRRRRLEDKGLQADIVPKNILMIGPTGVGKTEIARRMAKITDAPFVKVEATKYSEVGFKGKDVESMIGDLYVNAKLKARRRLEREREEEAQKVAMDVVYHAYQREASAGITRAGEGGASGIATTTEVSEETANSVANEADALIKDHDAKSGKKSTTTKKGTKSKKDDEEADAAATAAENEVDDFGHLTFEAFEAKVAKGELDTVLVTIDGTVPKDQGKGKQGPMSPEQAANNILSSLWGGGAEGAGENSPRVTVKVRQTLKDAIPFAKTEALRKLIDDGSVDRVAKTLCEEEGIIFIDEIDKVVSEQGGQNSDVSSMGVQQDLLPLIEGSQVNLKDGTAIQTDGILFVCSGAFHSVKPSEMIAELQGRLPVRVELQALKEEEFRRILVEPKFNLLKQQQALLKTEGVIVEFPENGINAIAKVTAQVNSSAQNIGARRLHSIIESIMDDFSFDTQQYEGKTVVIDEAHVMSKTKSMLETVDLSKYLI